MNIKSILTVCAASLILLACKSNQNENMSTLNLTREWDKTFPESELVNHSKVTFHNRYGIELAADMYVPNDAVVTPGRDRVSLPAIAVSGPFGAVKEQSSGLYAQHMAERGFLTIAFDPSYTGESGGEPRRMASPDINTEDFLAAVDFLSVNELVDPERIGIIGICGFALAAQRTKDYASGTYERAGGVIDPLPEDAPWFVKDYHAYYKTPRGYHERSGNSTDGWNIIGCQSFLNQPLLAWAGEIETPVLLIHGEKAHSRYFSEYAYSLMTGTNKELLIIHGASHVDLYDDVAGVIPYDKIESFFKANLK